MELARDPDPGEAGGVEVGDAADTVADPVEQRVMERDEDAVAGQVDVGLEVAVPEGLRVPERGHRVLPADQVGVPCAPAVGERQHRPPVVEERESGPVHGQEYAHRRWC